MGDGSVFMEHEQYNFCLVVHVTIVAALWSRYASNESLSCSATGLATAEVEEAARAALGHTHSGLVAID
jgi:hypothetical protein